VPLPGVWLGADIVMMEAAAIMGMRRIIKEKSEYAFDSQALEQKGDALLWGRWQSEKYFADAADAVRSAFTFRDPLTGIAADMALSIAATNSISLHVRRGDYAAQKNVAAFMGATDTAYYERAVAYMVQHVSDPHFFIFSDDIEWCKENIKLSVPVTYADDASAGPKSAFHLRLMSLCKHNIIANSTFSWWGAWLNANAEKIVIAPKKWFASDVIQGDYIIPEVWKKL
jgi:hypothetical protein